MGIIFGCPEREKKECPECPKCEECEDCNKRTHLTAGNKTVYTFSEIPGLELWVWEFNSKEEIDKYSDVVMENWARREHPIFSIIAMDSEKIEDATKIINIVIPQPLFSSEVLKRGGLMYNRKDDYQKLKILSNKLNELIKKYPSLYVYMIQGAFRLDNDEQYLVWMGAGDVIDPRYDKYEPLIKPDESFTDFEKSIEKNVKMYPKQFVMSLNGKRGDKLSDFDPRFISIMYTGSAGLDASNYESVFREKLTAEPSPEGFMSLSDGHTCTCIVLIVIIAICFIVFMFMRDPSPNGKEVEYDTEYNGEI